MSHWVSEAPPLFSWNSTPRASLEIARNVPISPGWWLTYPSEKYEFVSWDDEIPNIWKKCSKCSKPPTRMDLMGVVQSCMVSGVLLLMLVTSFGPHGGSKPFAGHWIMQP